MSVLYEVSVNEIKFWISKQGMTRWDRFDRLRKVFETVQDHRYWMEGTAMSCLERSGVEKEYDQLYLQYMREYKNEIDIRDRELEELYLGCPKPRKEFSE